MQVSSQQTALFFKGLNAQAAMPQAAPQTVQPDVIAPNDFRYPWPYFGGARKSAGPRFGAQVFNAILALQLETLVAQR